MAAPTAPTLSSIVTEGLKKAGYANPTSDEATLVTRAQNEWMAEIKNDIWSLSKKLTSLQTVGVVTLTPFLSKYSLPSDFSSQMKVTVVYGSHTGACQSGSTVSSIVLAAAEDVTSDYAKGKELVITSGTGVNQISQIYSYDSTTKTALVSPAYDTAPVASDGYMIVDKEDELTEEAVWNYDVYDQTDTADTPNSYYLTGDADNGEFYVRPVPDDSYTYVVKIRYYADLTRIDLAGTLMSTLYRRWENLFKQGIYARALDNIDDSKATQAGSVYGSLLQQLVMRETYGSDISNLRIQVSE